MRNFEDVVYLDIVDLDRNPNNCLILESNLPGKSSFYGCPHRIVQNVAAIVKEELRFGLVF